MNLLRSLSGLLVSSSGSALEDEQLELSRVAGTVWNAVLEADLPALQEMVRRDPAVLSLRGAVGELPIHLCFLYASAAHLRLASWILEHYPAQLTSVYEGAEYLGESVLHIALINQDLATVRMLVDRARKAGGSVLKDLLSARATGRFFQYGSACSYGETALSFACCTNQLKAARFLLDSGADLEAVDSRGNNILHAMVLHNLPRGYSFVKDEYRKRILGEGRPPPAAEGDSSASASSPSPSSPTPTPASPRLPPPATDLWSRQNAEGLTPFCLAAKVDARDMFGFLLQETRLTQWSYGMVSCDLYPLAELDLALPSESASDDGGERGPGALELIMNQGNVSLLMHPRIIDLVSQKWTKFAHRIFLARFRQVLGYLMLFTVTTILRQSVRHVAERMQAASEGVSAGPGNYVELPWALWLFHNPLPLRIMELLVLAGAAHKGSKEFAEMARGGVREYFSSSGSALLENSLSTLFCSCIFVVFVLALFGSPLESAVLALASIAGWSYTFFFLLAFRLTGPMVVMIQRMLFNDVMRFCLIYLVFLMGFAQAFFVLFESVGIGGFVNSVKTCFVAMLGDFELDQFADTPYTAVSVGLLVIYVVVITILLLNLLIAMMGNTYEKINESALSQWHLERARIIFAIENEMTAEEREDPANRYWTAINGERFLQVLEVNPNHFKSEIVAPAEDE